MPSFLFPLYFLLVFTLSLLHLCLDYLLPNLQSSTYILDVWCVPNFSFFNTSRRCLQCLQYIYLPLQLFLFLEVLSSTYSFVNQQLLHDWRLCKLLNGAPNIFRHKSDIRAICCSINKRIERRHFASLPLPASDIPSGTSAALHTVPTGRSLPSLASALSHRLVHAAVSAPGAAMGAAADPFGPLLLSVETNVEPSLKAVYRNNGNQVSNHSQNGSEILPSCPTLTPVTVTSDHPTVAVTTDGLLRSTRPILKTLKDVICFYYRKCQFDNPGDNEDIESRKGLEVKGAPRTTMLPQSHTQPSSKHSYWHIRWHGPWWHRLFSYVTPRFYYIWMGYSRLHISAFTG